jgi:hypothetical protein
MSEHELRAIALKTVGVLFYVAGLTTIIVSRLG